jgi:hypothetical protein
MLQGELLAAFARGDAAEEWQERHTLAGGILVAEALRDLRIVARALTHNASG